MGILNPMFLGILFYHFISENLTSHINKAEWETGNTNFDFAKLSDEDAEFGRKDTVSEKGFLYFLLNYSKMYRKMPKTIRI